MQAYLGMPSESQPPKRLVGFAKVTVAAGSSAQIEIVIDPGATHKPFSVWDYAPRAFQIVPGDYTLYVGTSSEETPHRCTVTVPTA